MTNNNNNNNNDNNNNNTKFWREKSWVLFTTNAFIKLYANFEEKCY